MTDQLCSGGTLVSILAGMQNARKNKAIPVSLACAMLAVLGSSARQVRMKPSTFSSGRLKRNLLSW